MITGHFGVAAAAKGTQPHVPLWALMLATVWLDIVFLPLLALGIETIENVPETNGGYGEVIIHADWTHSLVGAVLLSVLLGLVATRPWGSRAGLVLAAVAFSHWLLDLIVHRYDMPILPGNAGGLPRLGFGLWEFPAVSIALELALLLVGIFVYWRSARSLPSSVPGRSTTHARLISGGLLAAGLLTLGLDLLAI